MLRILCCGLAICLALANITASAQAARKFPTKYTYYLVAGSSANEVHQQLRRLGPVLRGIHAYASTAITKPKETRKLISDGKTCRVQAYSFTTSFVINLPQLKNPAALPAGERRGWHQFYAFARHHEEEHRAIWQSCWNYMSSQASALTASSCSGLNKKIDQLIKKTMANCEYKQEALDLQDRARLKNLSFIRQAQAAH